jgi:hypothetical protein
LPQSERQTTDHIVNDSVIPLSKHLKYLGETIDNDLGFRAHGAVAAAKDIQAIGALGFL